MARNHPNPLIGWIKALPPLFFGKWGYLMVPQKKKSFTRDPEKQS